MSHDDASLTPLLYRKPQKCNVNVGNRIAKNIDLGIDIAKRQFGLKVRYWAKSRET